MGFEHELIIPNEGFPFKIFQFEGKDGAYRREKHWHRSIEIFAVFEGSISFYINEEQYVLKAGEFILLNSNEIHSVHAPVPNKTLVLQIPLKLFEDYYVENQMIVFTHNPKKHDKKIMEYIQEIYIAYMEKKTGYEWKVKSDFFMLVYVLVTKYRQQEVSMEQLRHHKKLDQLSMITSYIREHYDKELSLEKVAQVFGYSPSYLSRMFQKYAKTNYKTYLQSVRIQYAFQEFANTSHTVSEIAMNHGFPNSKAFSKEFKRMYGVLPSEYRKEKKDKKMP
ncbi:MAG: helix-turn-helix transcriptional regulator [Firmicutes bacterium]|uniref:Helix-turn-helix transcriptional regulator n=1 Tax=Candidatus Scybalomonas excrementavium TaxID=2840943 RepID=A0A9D9HZU1_9FIRM|nr:helix-turn-helix transcriptional regulator [Candidatus Scybalomonas excrementavium]